MQGGNLDRLITAAIGALICASLLAGGVGYISPVQAQQPAPQKPIVIMATPRLPTAVPPTQAALPTEVPAPPPTPEPVVVVQYVPVPVPVEAIPPTVPPPPIEPAGETIVQINPVQEPAGVPHFGGRRNLNDGKADSSFGSMPEAVGP